MSFLVIVFVFALGTILGSFLNVVIYRYNSSVSPLTGRSQCFSCGKTLSPHELIPIVSFLVARGRCAGCGVKISWQYIIVEILTGATFVAVFLLGMPIPMTAIVLAIFCTLIVIAIYDLRHQIIPDGLVVLFAGLALLKFFIEVGFSNIFHFPFAWTLLAGPILFLPFWMLWFVSRGRWIGLGDGKLALGIGWFLGVTFGTTAVTFAFWIGATLALFAMAIQKVLEYMHLKSGTAFSGKLSMQSAVPFGPLLILAVFIVYFTRVNLFDLSGILQLSL